MFTKLDDTKAVKKTPQPDIEEIMTIDEKKKEIAEVEVFLAVKKQELQDLQDLGVKSESELAQISQIEPAEIIQ